MQTTTNPAVTDESPRIDAVCTVLDDEYAREVLESVATDAKTVPDILADCSASRSTVYRRLDHLESAGLVRSEMAYDPDGHHHRRYYARLSALTVTLEGDGMDVEVTVEGPSGTTSLDESRPALREDGRW